MAKAISRCAKEAGIPIKSARNAEDLGVTTTAGLGRTASSTNKRISKGKKRAERVGHLVGVNAHAANLYQTGVAPMQEYDLTINGWSNSQMKELRSSAARAQKRAGAQPCTTTLLRWR